MTSRNEHLAEAKMRAIVSCKKADMRTAFRLFLKDMCAHEDLVEHPGLGAFQAAYGMEQIVDKEDFIERIKQFE